MTQHLANDENDFDENNFFETFFATPDDAENRSTVERGISYPDERKEKLNIYLFVQNRK